MRWHVEFNNRVLGLAVWLDWLRPRHQPIVYWFWQPGIGRIFR